MTRPKTRRKIAAVIAAGCVGGAAGFVYAGPMDWGEAEQSPPQQAALAGGTAAAGRPAQAERKDPNLLAQTLTARLGDRTAGAYRDSSGRTVVAVTNQADAQMVRQAGAVPKLTTRDGADLARVSRALSNSMRIPGTGWAVDPATAQVRMWADDSVTGARLTAFRQAVANLGATARMERVPGRITKFAAGGEAIFGAGSRCSLGFNVRRGEEAFFLTAGHCGNAVQTWTADQQGAQVLGDTEESSFPGNDFALVRSAPGAEGEGEVALLGRRGLRVVGSQDIVQAADAVVGQQVRRSGSTTGTRDGQVTAVGATVNFADGGTVTDMIQTTVCAEPGDSGGPLFAGTTALGLTSGGSGNCTVGGVTFFQPVTEALQAFDVEVF